MCKNYTTRRFFYIFAPMRFAAYKNSQLIELQINKQIKNVKYK